VNKYVGPPFVGPRRMLPPGESCRVCAACSTKVRKKEGTDRLTDSRTLDRYITLTAIDAGSVQMFNQKWSKCIYKDLVQVVTHSLLRNTQRVLSAGQMVTCVGLPNQLCFPDVLLQLGQFFRVRGFFRELLHKRLRAYHRQVSTNDSIGICHYCQASRRLWLRLTQNTN